MKDAAAPIGREDSRGGHPSPTPPAPSPVPPDPFAVPFDPLASLLGGLAPPAPPTSLTAQPGGPTPREMAAVRKLCRTLLECVLAFNEGHLLRAAEKGPPPGLAGPARGAHEQGDPGAEAILLSPAQAAKRLAISTRTLQRLSQPSGPVPIVRIGRQVRYTPADLVAAVRAMQGKKEPS